LELFGAFAEFAGGHLCYTALNAGAHVLVQRRDDRKLVIHRYSGTGPPDIVALSLDDFYGTAALLPNTTLQMFFSGERHWAAFVAGAFPILARHKNMTRRTHGANIACFVEDVPSVALACATLSALTAAYHLPIEPVETALLAHKVHHLIAAGAPGITPAIAAMTATANHLLFLQGPSHTAAMHTPLPLGLHLLAIQIRPNDDLAVADDAADARLRAIAAVPQTIVSRMIKDLGIRKGPPGGWLCQWNHEAFHRYILPVLPTEIPGAAFLTDYGPPADRLAHVEPAHAYKPRLTASYLLAESVRAHAFETHLRSLVHDLSAEISFTAAVDLGRCLMESHNAACESGLITASPVASFVEQLVRRGADRGLLGARASLLPGNLVAVLVHAPDLQTARLRLEAVIEEFHQDHPASIAILDTAAPGASDFPVRRIPLERVVPV
jgi:galactokinase